MIVPESAPDGLDRAHDEVVRALDFADFGMPRRARYDPHSQVGARLRNPTDQATEAVKRLFEQMVRMCEP